MSTPAPFTPTLFQCEVLADHFRRTWPLTAMRCGGRLTAAAQIASTPGSVTPLGEGRYAVRSQSNPDGKYLVNLPGHTCTCPDHGKHSQTVTCKHRIAVWLYSEELVRFEALKPGQDLTLLYNAMSNARYMSEQHWKHHNQICTALESMDPNAYYGEYANRLRSIQTSDLAAATQSDADYHAAYNAYWLARRAQEEQQAPAQPVYIPVPAIA
jgi:hypothetical protein